VLPAPLDPAVQAEQQVRRALPVHPGRVEGLVWRDPQGLRDQLELLANPDCQEQLEQQEVLADLDKQGKLDRQELQAHWD